MSMLAGEFDYRQKHPEGDDDLFTEDSDKIRDMINEAVAEQMKDIHDDDKDSTGSAEALAKFIDSYIQAFKACGYSRKEAVFLAGMVLNGYSTGMSQMLGLGGLLS